MSTIRERRAEYFCDGRDTDALLAIVDELVDEIDVHGVCACPPPYPRGERHAPQCDYDPTLRDAIAHAREVTG